MNSQCFWGIQEDFKLRILHAGDATGRSMDDGCGVFTVIFLQVKVAMIEEEEEEREEEPDPEDDAVDSDASDKEYKTLPHVL